MAIALRGTPVGLTNSGGGTTITVTYPTGVQDGDVLLLHLALQTCPNGILANLPDPSGWTLLGGGAVGGVGFGTRTWWKIASSEPASFTYTFGSSLS
jgi:hypothetical protein